MMELELIQSYVVENKFELAWFLAFVIFFFLCFRMLFGLSSRDTWYRKVKALAKVKAGNENEDDLQFLRLIGILNKISFVLTFLLILSVPWSLFPIAGFVRSYWFYVMLAIPLLIILRGLFSWLRLEVWFSSYKKK